MTYQFRFQEEPFEFYAEDNEAVESLAADSACDEVWQGEVNRNNSDYPRWLQRSFDSAELEQELSVFDFPEAVLKALRSGLESVAIKLAVGFGFRDENELTSLVFFARHPERAGKKLVKGEPRFEELSREWLDIRDRLVRPALIARPSQTVPSTRSCVVSGNSVSCGSCVATERRLLNAPTPMLVSLPSELKYSASGATSLDAEAVNAYQRLLREARTASISSPYLKIKSGYRPYDEQARLWRSRLLRIFEQRGCSSSQRACIELAINRTSQGLRPLPLPHGENTWLDRFLQELRRTDCGLVCDPRAAVRQLRRGTAPPGRSPHHTGRAVDVHVGGRISTATDNVRFQRNQEAYRWLVCNAARFGFYPYNREPWHWEYNPPSQQREFGDDI